MRSPMILPFQTSHTLDKGGKFHYFESRLTITVLTAPSYGFSRPSLIGTEVHSFKTVILLHLQRVHQAAVRAARWNRLGQQRLDRSGLAADPASGCRYSTRRPGRI